MKMTAGLRTLGVAAALATFALPAGAQAPAQQEAPAQAQPSSIPDQKIEAAAAALEKVSNIKRSYEDRIKAATPAEQERIVGEANTELSKAVTDQGLSVEEYNSIIQVAQADPQVREKILKRVKFN